MSGPFWSNWVFWLYAAAWLPYTLFAFFYGTREPWWTEPIGRSLLLSKTAISLTLTNVLIALAFPDFPRGVRIVLICLVASAGWYMLVALLRLQRQARRCRSTKES